VGTVGGSSVVFFFKFLSGFFLIRSVVGVVGVAETAHVLPHTVHH